MPAFRHLKTRLTFPHYYPGDRGGMGEVVFQIFWIQSSFTLPSEGFFCSSVDSKVI